MPQVDTFSELQIARSRDGDFFELLRNDLEVVCLAYLSARQCMVELHVFHADGGGGPHPDVFIRQASAAARIQNPQAARVLDFGEDDGACFYLSEFSDGELLEDYIDRCAPLPESIALELVLNAARGLSACATELPVLAGMDLLQSRVRLDHPNAQSLTLKVGGYSFGSRKAETLAAAGVHEYYIRSLAEVLIWAVTGKQISVDELTDEDSMDWSVPSLTLLEALAGDRPSVRSLDSAAAAIERTLGSVRPDTSEPSPLPDSLLPLLPLEPYLVTPEELHDYLGEDYPLSGDPLNPRTPLRLTTIDSELQQRGTVQLLPADDALPPDVAAKLQSAMGKGSALDHPNLIRLLAHWPDENAGFFIEEDAGSITLEDAIAWKGGFTPEEAVLVLLQLETASAQALECGLTADLRGAGQIVFHFLDGNTTEDLPLKSTLRNKPLSTWPAFRIRVRTYPTLLSMLRCPYELARPVGASCRTEALAFAWWTRQMLGAKASLHPKLSAMIDDVLTGKAGATIHTGAEFLRAFQALIESPRTGTKPANRPQSVATNAAKMTSFKGKRSLRATHAVARKEPVAQYHSDNDVDWEDGEEMEMPVPGLAEALFQMGGNDSLAESPAWNGFDDGDGGESASAQTDEDEMMDAYDNEPASSLWLVIIVVLIALLLAAVSAQLSGNAFWLR
ncbi:MAG: hypothetical protein KDN22_27445 [Verrucomicrobiae bacterium]|nr:hypothetical protein [Verrucomicrobiae bacterium]